MSNLPFSVAMSVYKNDSAEFFDRALKSITEEQTVKPSEIVLVVDGPVGDEINQVIEKYSSAYGIFNVVRLEQNGGLGNALKLAVENSSNELIARMDSDDVSLPTRFEKQLQLMEQTGADIVGGFITEFIDSEDNIVGMRQVPLENEDIKRDMKKRCAMNHMTVMYKKSAVLACGGYLDWHYNEDYYLWIRMLLNGATFGNSQDVFVNVSEYEGTSLSMLEAMSFGCVPVVTDVSGAREFIEEGENGYICGVGDIEGIAKCVAEFASDRKRLMCYGEKCRDIIQERCNPKEYIKYWVKNLLQ